MVIANSELQINVKHVNLVGLLLSPVCIEFWLKQMNSYELLVNQYPICMSVRPAVFYHSLMFGLKVEGLQLPVFHFKSEQERCHVTQTLIC